MRHGLKLGIAMLAFAVSAFASVTVSSPTSGATVSSPVHVVASASASSGHTITGMKVYVDDREVYYGHSNRIDTNVSLSGGSHHIVVQSWQDGVTVQRASLGITVSGTSTTTPTTTPSGAKTFYKIEEMSDWHSCDRCAGKYGDGPAAPHSMTQWVKSPSRDGASARFFLGGDTAYSNALWWRQMGANPAVRHFVYDTWFYIKNPSASQALEFDINQALNGKKYIFGTECSMKRHEWDIYDAYNRRWVSSGVACQTPAAYTWHHLVWEFERTTDNKVRFVAITVNGVKKYVNRSYYPRASTTKEISVAFQMDGISTMVDYYVWLDQLKVTYW